MQDTFCYDEDPQDYHQDNLKKQRMDQRTNNIGYTKYDYKKHMEEGWYHETNKPTRQYVPGHAKCTTQETLIIFLFFWFFFPLFFYYYFILFFSLFLLLCPYLFWFINSQENECSTILKALTTWASMRLKCDYSATTSIAY